MMNVALFSKLTQTRVLWLSFITTLLLTLTFGVIMYIWQFVLIDEMYDPDQILAHIAAMSPTQKTAHVWMTATVDVAYPLAYGSFFIGMALRFFGRFGPWLSLPSLVLIFTDLTEGVIQVLLLTGHDNFVWIKAIVTPLKLVLFTFGLAISLIGAVIALRQSRKQV